MSRRFLWVIGCAISIGALCALDLAVTQQAGAQSRGSRNETLWNLARKACIGKPYPSNFHDSLAQEIGLDSPTRAFIENVSVDKEHLTIASRDCSQESAGPAIYFLVGHVQKGGHIFYKISTDSTELLAAAFCHYEQKYTVLKCNATEPMKIDGNHKIFSEDLENDFKATLQIVIQKWGH